MTEQEMLTRINDTGYFGGTLKACKVTRHTIFERHCGKPLMVVKASKITVHEHCHTHSNRITYPYKFVLCTCPDCTYTRECTE
jgi:hypothetical protein